MISNSKKRGSMEYSGNPRVPGGNEVNVKRSSNKPMAKKSRKGLPMGPMNMVFAAFVAAIAVLLIALMVFMTVGGSKSESELIKKDQYQAVFLSDNSGQVYFGKLKSLNNKYYELTDIFYVKVENAVQPDRNNTAAQNISLAKLGNELHGPEDVMYISRDKVLFWENLKNDGQVVKAITEFKKNGSTSNTNQSQTQPQSSTQQTENTQNTTNNQNISR